MPNYLSPGVYVEEVEAGSRPIEGVGTAVAAFVGLAARGPANTPTLVTNWNQFTSTFGEFVEGSYLAHAVYGYFLNGGGAAYVVRVGADGAMPHRARRSSASAKDKATPAYRVAALEAGPAGNDITVDVAAALGDRPRAASSSSSTRAARPSRCSTTSRPARARHNVVTDRQGAVEAHLARGGRQRQRVERVPATGGHALAGGGASVPVRVTPDDYVGNSADRTGFAGLEAVDEVTMLACPDLMAVYQQGIIDLEGLQAVQLAMIAHCELMGDRVAILDAPPGLNAQQVKEWRVDKAGYDSKYATLYWPWVKVFDPLSGQATFVPAERPHRRHLGPQRRHPRRPQGAGQRGRSAARSRSSSTSPRASTTSSTRSGINCIRAFPGRGIRVWGARTLSSDPAWRYLNVRRLFNYVEESIFEGTQWVVFEPNDQRLWGRVKRTINAFLLRVWRDGALFGATPDQAFFVKCDDENNPPEVRDAGQLDRRHRHRAGEAGRVRGLPDRPVLRRRRTSE